MSGLKRTSSSSNIPLPRVDARSRSKSTSRASLKESADKRCRSGSIDRLTVPKLSFGSTRYKKSSATPTSSSVSKKKRSLATPLSGASGYTRSDTATPSTSRTKSPFSVGSERKVNDPKWVSQQFSKVRNFLQQHPNCPEQILTSLKPISINSFVYLMNLLLKEINPHIEVTTMNYKDVVLNHLKTLHYPGPLTNSLLKTVNTNYAWPQIISIFSWLVDLILVIRRVDLPVSPELAEDLRYKKMECLTEYIIKKYYMYNNNEDTEAADIEFVKDFGAILNVDDKECIELAKDVEALRIAKENKLQSIEKIQSENNELRSTLEKLKNETNQYNLNKNKKFDELSSEIERLKKKRAKLAEKVASKRAATSSVLELIKTQPCTGDDKRRIKKHIEELKHTIDLKKEKLRVQKEVKIFCEEKLVETKKKIEKECYRINNELMKLVVHEPKLKILQMKEGYSDKNELKNDVQNLMENFKNFETNLNTELSTLESHMTQMDKKIDLILKQKDLAGKCVNELKLAQKTVTSRIEELNLEMENMLKTKENNKRIFGEKVKEFKEIENEYMEVNKQYEEAKQRKEKKQAAFEQLKIESRNFFYKLSEIMSQNLTEMDDVYNEVFGFMQECLKKVEEHQARIVKDLESLDSVKKQ